jgi:hypothetical protein
MQYNPSSHTNPTFLHDITSLSFLILGTPFAALTRALSRPPPVPHDSPPGRPLDGPLVRPRGGYHDLRRGPHPRGVDQSRFVVVIEGRPTTIDHEELTQCRRPRARPSRASPLARSADAASSRCGGSALP